ncbi:DNA ligase 1 [Engraulis encrasicolus]|uniref:DNA ligase 1 n=1 Tax=Engraulis encrasicolus TaxID=184585 RepID=UPI002FD10D9A
MQRSIAAFFSPVKGKEKSDGQTKVKSEPLKQQNGNQEADSPVKRPISKRSRAIADSDEEDGPIGKEQTATQMNGRADRPVGKEQPAKEESTPSTPLSPKTPVSPAAVATKTPVSPAAVATKTPVSPAAVATKTPLSPATVAMKTPISPATVSVKTPVTPATPATPATVSTATPDTPTSASPSGIPKRRTARKQFPKRKLHSPGDGEMEKDGGIERQPEGEQDRKRARTEDTSDEKMESQTAEESEKVNDKKKGGEEECSAVEEKEMKKEQKTPLAGEGEEGEEMEVSTADVKKEEEEKTVSTAEEKKKDGDEKKNKKVGDEKKDEKKHVEREEKAKRTESVTEVKKEKEGEKEGKKEKEGDRGKKTEEKKEAVAKKAPISSFFTPRKAAVKLVKTEESEGDKEDGKKPATPETKKTQSPVSEKEAGSVDQSQYDPSKSGYHPIDHACWTHGQKVPYLAVARTFEKIEEDSGRLRNIETLSNFLRSVILLSPEDLLCCLYLCLNQLGPAYQGLELGVGETVLMRAVAQATGRQLEKIKAEAAERGDLGLVAESSRSNQRMMCAPAKLSVRVVFNKLKEIANMSGNSAMNKKIDIIKSMFVACRQSEARFIIRSLAGKLRIGLAEQSVIAALTQAVCLSPPGQEFPPAVVDAGKKMSTESKKAWLDEKNLILKQTYCEMPNYDVIIPVLMKEGIDELPNHCRLTPGVPLKPMLAHPTKGVGEVMKRFDEAAFTCEYKYDGERAQIHILENGEVKIFSRNQEDNTTKYPDIIARIPKVKKGSVVSCVLDSEAVAWDREKKQIQPFQVLTTRKRKDVDAADIKVQVCVYAFDLLYLNGKSLVREPLRVRRELLRESFEEQEGEFVFAKALDASDTEAIGDFLEQSVRDSCEGLMVKTLERDATYEIAKRSHNWLKLKKDYLEGVGDTVDLCVVGAYLGKGKRAGTYGGFLLACYDEENEEFQSVCKIGTGFKDEDLEQHYNFLKEHIIPKARPYYRVDQSAEPEVWLDAVQVWEVKCADLSLSPVYKAAMGLVDAEKGVSLRFPRFLRIRDDKKPEDATTASQVADLYKRQQQIQNQGDKADPEDYY